MKNIEEFADEVISKKNKVITDEVFLLIQNDKVLMHQYLRLVEKHGLDLVNRTIGMLIKKKYGLENDTQRCTNPTSTLIMSHQEFE
ncbi:hypothetical protein [Dysgonomonas termitidis]|uniref:Uncharacterized protein n=1 Tax=Dysgonomonas termitidis TaxID=1516126 RepID=A0ABV9KV46_9BACT